jgi:hypothetical protein
MSWDIQGTLRRASKASSQKLPAATPESNAMEFVHLTSGWCAIGNLKEADKILAGEAGTMVRNNADPNHIEYYEPEAKRLESGNTAAT